MATPGLGSAIETWLTITCIYVALIVVGVGALVMLIRHILRSRRHR